MAQGQPETLTEVLETIANTDSDKTTEDGKDAVTFGRILRQFDSRSFGPLLLIVAIIAVGPTGMIPGMSILTGTLVIAICGQMLVGRDHIWVPDRAQKFRIARDKIGSLVERAKPITSTIDKAIHRRWTFLVDGPALYIMGIVCIGLALTMFPLALLPFAVAIPGTAIGLFALALTAKDGLLAFIGYVVAAGAIYALTFVAF
ncbi:MAG: exopolysaccharide biosynthesis protein [Pseudomonadota bacterium]